MKDLAPFEQDQLSNGLRLIAQERPTTNSLSLGLWFNSGSRDEPKDRSGATHLIEHLVFRGTATRSADEISRTVDRLGGRMNAGTGREYMLLYLDLLPDGLEEGISLLADLVKNPLFDSNHLDLEKNVVLEELRSKQDKPQYQALQLFREALWGKDSGLALPVAGKAESIQGLARSELISRFQSMKDPTNLVLSVAGNVQFDQFVNCASQYLSDLTPTTNMASTRSVPVSDNSCRTKEGQLQQSHLSLGVQSLEKGHDDRYVQEMLNVILGKGMSSRLFRLVRKELGLAYQISSRTEYFSDSGFFLIYGVADESNVQQVTEVVVDQLKDLQENLVTEEELQLAKQKTKGNLVLGLESNHSHMVRLGGSLIYEVELEPVTQVIQQIEEVTRKDVRRVTRRLFSTDRLVFSLLGPNSNDCSAGEFVNQLG